MIDVLSAAPPALRFHDEANGGLCACVSKVATKPRRRYDRVTSQVRAAGLCNAIKKWLSVSAWTQHYILAGWAYAILPK